MGEVVPPSIFMNTCRLVRDTRSNPSDPSLHRRNWNMIHRGILQHPRIKGGKDATETDQLNQDEHHRLGRFSLGLQRSSPLDPWSVSRRTRGRRGGHLATSTRGSNLGIFSVAWCRESFKSWPGGGGSGGGKIPKRLLSRRYGKRQIWPREQGIWGTRGWINGKLDNLLCFRQFCGVCSEHFFWQKLLNGCYAVLTPLWYLIAIYFVLLFPGVIARRSDGSVIFATCRSLSQCASAWRQSWLLALTAFALLRTWDFSELRWRQTARS
jgi:hypothetical protein